ncbi:hypothetical protein [Paenibacillus azoreducens]|uniref:hypothetical protein n=1 Tax=Paenibacillus azoreducens TaxID=116718 RepID=UPI001F3CF3AF|nr:hypothetical protein [Paenibacillus azoreducens]
MGKDRLLELTSFAWVVIGGEALDEGLRLLFHRIGPASIGSNSPYTFPSEQTLISMTVCGFAAYLLNSALWQCFNSDSSNILCCFHMFACRHMSHLL